MTSPPTLLTSRDSAANYQRSKRLDLEIENERLVLPALSGVG